MKDPVVVMDLPSRLDLVTVARMVAAAAAACSGTLEDKRIDDLRWVTSEATTNAIQANLSVCEDEDAVPGRVKLELTAKRDAMKLVVQDEGPGLPPETIVPEITDPDRLNIEGAFGVPLMRLLSSGEVLFSTGAGGTTVELELKP